MKISLFICGIGLALVSACTDYSGGKSSIRFSWAMGESGPACAGKVDQLGIFLASEGGGVFYDGYIPCSNGEATIDGLELGSYQLILTGICGGLDIGYEFDSRDVGSLEVTIEGLRDLGVITLEKISNACDSSDCQPGEGAALIVTTNPSTAQVRANGIDVIKTITLGQDENCKPLDNGTPIEFRITDQDPANPNHDPSGVGYFADNRTTIVVPYSAFGASTDVRGTVAGTAKVSAFCETYNLTAFPVDIEFTQLSQCEIELAADPPIILADGASTSAITATLIADAGGPMPDGTPVTFTTTRGEFTESGGNNYDTQTSNNVATATLQSEDSQTNMRADVTASFTCDNTQLHSNQVGVTFEGLNAPVVDLRASSNEVLADNVSTVDLTAEVFLPGGARAGAGEEVTFFSELGRFQESGGPTYVAYTNDSGTATATFIGGNQGGVARVRASIFIDNMAAYDEVEIIIRQLGFIEFVSAVPDKLGTQGSGRNESSLITFAVKDTEGNPFPSGALVEFEVSMAPGGITLDPQVTRTDSNGEASTILFSGIISTIVTVTATAYVGTEILQEVSAPIAIVGAKPNARYMTFSCEQYNVGGLILSAVDTGCTISLADRYSNKIGFATTVIFRTEAGSIDSSAMTSEAVNNMGMATATLRTGNPRPKDVEPVADEPFIGSHNPRDGIVTIIAVTTGEEEFDDVNGNGSYDVGEPFAQWEKGEPFLDNDDDGVRDPDEQFIDANDNLQYDGPNGIWDSDTLIWDVAYMLWTGNMEPGDPATDCVAQYRYSVLCPDSFTIAKGDDLEFTWEVKDINLNPLNETTRVDATVLGKGSLGAAVPPLPWTAPDTLGGFEDSQHYWDSCGGGFCGRITVSGAPLTDPNPAAAGSVTVDVSYYASPGAGWENDETLSVSGIFE